MKCITFYNIIKQIIKDFLIKMRIKLKMVLNYNLIFLITLIKNKKITIYIKFNKNFIKLLIINIEKDLFKKE